MNLAPSEQPDGLPDGQLAEQPASPPEYVAPVQPVAPSSRRSRPLIAAAILAGAIGLSAVAIGLAFTGTPAAPAPAPVNARGVLLGADTGTWTAPNGGTAAAPNMPGMLGGGPSGGFGPGGGRMGGPGAFGSITITAINGTQLSLTTADGWTRTIDGAGATVKNDGQTVDLSTLKVGDSITFSQAHQTDGTYKITSIQVVLPHVAGTVKSVSGSSVTLTERGGTDTVIQVNGSTTYKLAGVASSIAALTVGAQVDAQGTIVNGTFTATLVNIQPAMAGGTVTANDGSSKITVKTRTGSSLTIIVSAATKYQVAGKTNATLSDIAVGANVMAQGSSNPDGMFSATVIRAFSAGAASGPGFGPGMRGGHGMPWSRGGNGTPPTPAPAGTTN
jgi:hypothetical protein